MRTLILFLALTGAAFGAASPNDTVVLTGSSAVITDSAGNAWGISTAACIGYPAGNSGMVTLNGTPDKNSCNVVEIAYVSGVIWHENTSKNWYSRTAAGGWTGGTQTSPLPAGGGTTPPPTPPTYPSAASLGWVEAADSAITVPLTYNVYRGTTATSLTKLTSVTGTTYSDPAGSATPTTYYYAVTATCAGCTESPQSDIQSVTIAAPALTPPAPVLTVK